MEKMRKAEYTGGYEDGKHEMLALIEKMVADGLTEQIPRLSKEGDFLQEMIAKYQK